MKVVFSAPCVLIVTVALFGAAVDAEILVPKPGFPRVFAGAEEPEFAARFEPSSPAIVKEMVRLAGIIADDLVYDLGSGDGRILIAAALESGARGIGVEIDPELVAESRRNAGQAKVSDLVQFRQEDLFRTGIRDATIVMLYLSPEANLKLRPRLLAELKPGSRIVSHSHDMGDWEPNRESSVNGHTIYAWIVPADVSGLWKLEVNDENEKTPHTIKFVQSYQHFLAFVQAGGKKMPITGTGLNGSRIQFTLEQDLGNLGAPLVFSGNVKENTIRGTFQSSTGSGRWTARRLKSP